MHMDTKAVKKGILAVIDGVDGSGKGTHTNMLVERLQNEGHDVLMMDFPRYGMPSARFVEYYLRGEMGTADEVGPYRASVYYAEDRADAAPEIMAALARGAIVLCNRYVSSNMGHQAGKIADPVERERFLLWLKEYEYEVRGIPIPDINILLYVTPEMGQLLVDNKSARAYTQGMKRDIHEADIEHLRHSSEAYLEVARKESWKIISLMDGDVGLRDKADVHEEIYAYLKAVSAI